jgi:hypothetical protein
VKVHVKLRAQAAPSELVEALIDIDSDTEPLFPDAEDELSRLYVVSVADDDASRTLEALAKLDAVEYAEPEPARRLVE